MMGQEMEFQKDRTALIFSPLFSYHSTNQLSPILISTFVYPYLVP